MWRLCNIPRDSTRLCIDPIWLVISFVMVVYDNILVVLYTENSDWTFNNILIAD